MGLGELMWKLGVECLQHIGDTELFLSFPSIPNPSLRLSKEAYGGIGKDAQLGWLIGQTECPVSDTVSSWVSGAGGLLTSGSLSCLEEWHNLSHCNPVSHQTQFHFIEPIFT